MSDRHPGNQNKRKNAYNIIILGHTLYSKEL